MTKTPFDPQLQYASYGGVVGRSAQQQDLAASRT